MNKIAEFCFFASHWVVILLSVIGSLSLWLGMWILCAWPFVELLQDTVNHASEELVSQTHLLLERNCPFFQRSLCHAQAVSLLKECQSSHHDYTTQSQGHCLQGMDYAMCQTLNGRRQCQRYLSINGSVNCLKEVYQMHFTFPKDLCPLNVLFIVPRPVPQNFCSILSQISLSCKAYIRLFQRRLSL